MAKIPDHFLQSVVYLYESREDALAGQKVGGTGFLVGVPTQGLPGGICNYLVTNDHVAVRAGAVRFNTSDGSMEALEVAPVQWTSHPNGDDIAVRPFEVSLGLTAHHSINVGYVLDRAQLAQYFIGPGDETFTLGRFIAHDGTQRNTPVARFGAISMMPGEPVRQPERAGFLQESFLIESRSLSGFSGSPVFVYVPPFSHRFPNGMIEDGAELSAGGLMGLLGVDWGHLNLPDDEKRLPTGIMGAVPCWKLQELLALEEIIEQRQQLVADCGI